VRLLHLRARVHEDAAAHFGVELVLERIVEWRQLEQQLWWRKLRRRRREPELLTSEQSLSTHERAEDPRHLLVSWLVWKDRPF
jgi:hypothetical protein